VSGHACPASREAETNTHICGQRSTHRRAPHCPKERRASGLPGWAGAGGRVSLVAGRQHPKVWCRVWVWQKRLRGSAEFSALNPECRLPGVKRTLAWEARKLTLPLCCSTPTISRSQIGAAGILRASNARRLRGHRYRQTMQNELSKQLLRRRLPIACKLLCLGDLLVSHPP
jgi:hypothetical protein